MDTLLNLPAGSPGLVQVSCPAGYEVCDAENNLLNTVDTTITCQVSPRTTVTRLGRVKHACANAQHLARALGEHVRGRSPLHRSASCAGRDLRANVPMLRRHPDNNR